MIFFVRFSSSTAFSIWQPKNAQQTLGDKRVCILKLATLRSKVVQRISERCGVFQFTTHTPRHLRLTDLARSDWDVHEIATFAGHRSIQTTLIYIHLSGRELSQRIARGMAEIHAWRSKMLEDLLK